MQQQNHSLPSRRPPHPEQQPHNFFPQPQYSNQQQQQPPAASVFDVLRESIVSGQIHPSPAEAAQIYTMMLQYGASQETLSDMALVLQHSTASQAAAQMSSSPAPLSSPPPPPSVAATGGLLNVLRDNVGVFASAAPNGQALPPPTGSDPRFVMFVYALPVYVSAPKKLVI
ncbi:hypothetical protein HDU88_008652 [Geranomyces variabilis]|nr:hypothetical protein HDU88_008652 [Geranomyces variabilis]